jgi:DNA-binding XRE family transcriptional regulator
MKGTILADGKAFGFSNLFQVTIQIQNQLWVLDGTPTATVLKFRPASAELTFKLASGEWKGGGTSEYLRRWRKMKHYNQKEAAKELGVSPSLIGKIESGRRKMPVKIFNRIRKDFWGQVETPEHTEEF